YFALSWGEYTLLDAADLVVHEAGHLLFAPFGRFLHIAGGTLWQLALPAVIAGSFLSNGYRFGVQVGLLWLGQSCINVSVYAADARTRALPLLGGDPAGHDWWNLLRMTGLLEYDGIIGGAFYCFGLVVFGALLVLPRFMPG
ncbi:MAG: hypothetical protein R3362_11570, partial [Rhodothermales bacterium]|nr:hypothetical protein [Rhodothermales bacterium]